MKLAPYLALVTTDRIKAIAKIATLLGFIGGGPAITHFVKDAGFEEERVQAKKNMEYTEHVESQVAELAVMIPAKPTPIIKTVYQKCDCDSLIEKHQARFH